MENEAIIYVADAKTGKWLDAKIHFGLMEQLHPMDFGFSAYEEKQDGTENFALSYVLKKIKRKNHQITMVIWDIEMVISGLVLKLI